MGYVGENDNPDLYIWAKTHKDGDISSPPVKTEDGVQIVKRVGSRVGETEVDSAHILICYQGATGCDPSITYTQNQALKLAEEVKQKATPANFRDLVQQYSTEPGAAARGGDLGFLKQSQLVSDFATPLWAAATGTIIGPIKTDFGYHIIYKKAARNQPEYKLSRIYFKYQKASDILPPADQWKNTGLSGKQLKKAEVTEDQRTGAIQVSLNFNDEGTKLFGDLTTRNVGKKIAIFLDGSPITNPPTVNEPILSGSAVITGSFNLAEARLLAQRLNSGALPVPIDLISQEQVDATLGAGSLAKSFFAGMVGLALVMIFMVIYYRLPGVLSVFSLFVYAALNLAIFKLIGVTLTLAGIAGFILSIGMAVDANVLVFERLKEELRLGKTLRTASEESFMRAWPSIRDGHVTGLISCALLIWFGSGFIQGFAVVLGIGTLVSLFTNISVTRAVMRFTFYYFPEFGNKLFLGYTEKPPQAPQQ
jgi:protein-export membrane protein SecD